MRFFLSFFLLFLSSSTFSQVRTVDVTDKRATRDTASQMRCGSDEWRVHRMGLFPEHVRLEQTMNNRIRTALQQRNSRNENVYIPVVVHVVHTDGPENISAEVIQQGIADLNDAFANQGAYYSPDGVDTHIRFCLAQQDPQGLPTNGITRNYSFLTTVFMESSDDDSNLKLIENWDPLHYLNIWLVSEITSVSMGSGVAGYAMLPYAHGSPIDGIVNEARWFGANTDYSKVHIHEVGHYLGLYHIFEGGCANNDCTADGDKVCDTPPDANTGFLPCGNTINSCTTDDDDTSANNPFRSLALGGLGDQDDLVENYMDYSNQLCQTLFTPGQSVRMNDALNEIRHNLLESQGCFNSCGIGLIEFESSTLEVNSGTTTLINPSIYTSISPNYEWQFNGVTIGNEATLEYTFSDEQAGNNLLSLTVSHPEGLCSTSDSIIVRVRCSISPEIERSPEFIDFNTLVHFTANSTNSTVYSWYLNDSLYSTESAITTSFAEGGSYSIYLVTSNNICSDTSEVMPFVVGECYSRCDNHWIIGTEAGVEIDFSSGTPQVSEIPNTATNGIQTIEGLATISDRNGELSFYSDGVNLYNKLHERFFEGLGAGFSSSQGVQIVPSPANPNQYYVFTAEHFAGQTAQTFRGFAYLIVDMTLNEGLGGVASNYTTLIPFVTERQTAVRHCNGRDVWVICHEYNNNKFYSYLINDQGLQPPVITEVGPVMDIYWWLGQMISSPQGDRIAITSWNGIQLYDFDKSTGILSYSYPQFSSSFFQTVYGAAFSPDGSKLYFNNGEGGPQIWQANLSSGNDAMMANSIMPIGTSQRPNWLGSMATGPDGRIYIAQSSSFALDVIAAPNETGTNCQFIPNGLLLPRSSLYGLNNVLSSPINSIGPQISGVSSVCPNATDVVYRTNCNTNVWTYRGGGTMHYNDATSIYIDFGSGGVDTLICTSSNVCSGNASDTLLIYVGSDRLFLGNDTTICSTGNLTLQPSDYNYTSYQWSNGSTSNQINVQNAGTYWLRVTSTGGCIYRDTLRVFIQNIPFNVPDTSILVCDAEAYITVPNPFPQYEAHWFAISEPPAAQLNFYLSAGQNYNFPIYYRNAQGCYDYGNVQLVRRDTLPQTFVPPLLEMCAGEIEVVHIDGCTECSYTWQDGSNDNPYTIYSPSATGSANYYVTRFDSLCRSYAINFIQVYTYDSLNYFLPGDFTSCISSSHYVFVSGYYSNYEWQDGSTNYFYEVTSPGTYWVKTISPCGVFSDTLVVSLFQAPPIGLPDSLEICSHQTPYYLQVNPQLYNYTWTNASWGFVDTTGTVTVTAFDQCGWQRDTVFVTVLPSPIENIPGYLPICDSSSVVIGLDSGQINEWNGVVTDSITIMQNGIYRFTTGLSNGCRIQDSIEVVFSSVYFEVSDTSLCEGSSLEIIPSTNATQIWWYDGQQTDTLTVSTPGEYWAVATNYICTNVFSFIVGFTNDSTNVLSLPDSLSFCAHAFPVVIEAEIPDALSIAWSNGDTTASASIHSPGWNNVLARYACGQKSDSVFVGVLAAPTLDLPEEITLCKNDSVLLIAPTIYDNVWNNAIAEDSLLVNNSGTYFLQSTNELGCNNIDSVQVLPSSLFAAVPNSITICPNLDTLITASTNGEAFFWNTGSNALSETLSAPGVYTFTASLNGCLETDTLLFREFPDNAFTLGNDTVAQTSPFVLQSPPGFTSYFWTNTGSSEPLLNITNAGEYELMAVDAYGCIYKDDIVVNFANNTSFIQVPSLFFQGNELVANYRNVTVYDVKIFDSAGRLVSLHRNFPLVWDGRMQGASAAAGMYYYIINYSDAAQQKSVLKGKTQLMK